MSRIDVRARPGRVAFTAPARGKRIPEDRFITVHHTPWIDRLIGVHGDLEFRVPEEAPVTPVEPAEPEPTPQAGSQTPSRGEDEPVRPRRVERKRVAESTPEATE